ncbi:MAG: hypothetical protein HY858_11610 [Candidatus Solibacter usitatus]|nr:hypothetical protein [Candidatus Solibacter usitatus]
MNKQERLQRVWHHYDGGRDHLPSSAREACEWAVSEGLLELPSVDPYDVLAGEMAQALRSEYGTDEKGRRYRENHAVRVTKAGVQYTFWAAMRFAPHEHMERAFAQRRDAIVGDCSQLKTDVDAYNSMVSGKRPSIQLILDFTEDIAEREAMGICRAA